MSWFSFPAKIFRRLNPQYRELRAKLFNDPYYRLQSYAEVAIAAELGIKIDVNQASVDDWLRLPGISIHQARSLVELSGVGLQFFCLEDIAAALSVPIPRLKPLEPILNFYYYDPEAPFSPSRININTASLEQLRQIPVLEVSLAQQIVANRPYGSLAELQQRLALKTQLISQLMHYLKF